jgi:hypothetical protein
MDSSFLQSQHPVVEELLTNKYFGDTLLVCANGHLTDNKVILRESVYSLNSLFSGLMPFFFTFFCLDEVSIKGEKWPSVNLRSIS